MSFVPAVYDWVWSGLALLLVGSVVTLLERWRRRSLARSARARGDVR